MDYELEHDEEANELQLNDSWTVISSYFSQKGLVRQQLDSFDEFIAHTVQEVVEESIPIEVFAESGGDEDGDAPRKHVVKFGQIYLAPPQISEADGTSEQLFPNMARLRGLTYAAPLYVDVERRVLEYDADRDEEVEVEQEVTREFIGRVPIMLKSSYCVLKNVEKEKLALMGECPFDQGGYFVVHGNEKVLVAQERASNNKTYVYPPNKGQDHFTCEIRSQSEGTSKPVQPLYVRLVKPPKASGLTAGVIHATIPYIRAPIPICIVFRALGFVPDRDILEHIVYDFGDSQMMDILRPSMEEAFVVQTQDVALDYIGKRGTTTGATRDKRIEHARQVLQMHFLPHISTEESAETEKTFFFGYMINRLLSTVLGRRPFDDRDHYGNKRLDLAGPLMGNLFRQLFAKMLKECRAAVRKKVDAGKPYEMRLCINQDTISRGLHYALATGNWGDQKKAGSVKTGVAQKLDRLTFSSMMSHLRRLNTGIGKEGKAAKPRQLHNTQWGMVCPAEVPEGQACGLVKNLALMAYVTVGCSGDLVRDVLDEWTLEALTELQPETVPEMTKVFVNGAWLGVHREPDRMVETLRSLRREVDLPVDVSIVWDVRERELHLYSDAGRVCRPLYIVDGNRLRAKKEHVRRLESADDPYTFIDLVKGGLIEYIDTDEEETIMCGMSIADLRLARENEERGGTGSLVRYTHCEIHPSMILGVCGSIIPFPDHNQSPRNTYQSAMGKQAMGMYITNYLLRFDTMAHVLFYPQRPLVCTRAMEYLHFRELPAGQNAVVAISVYSGYNQEDSVIMNKGALDRGFFRSTFYRKYGAEEARQALMMQDEFERPNPETTGGMKFGSYDKIEADGLIAPGTRISKDDIIIGMTSPLPPLDDVFASERQRKHTKKDSSLGAREPGVVDQVMLTTNADGLKHAKVRVRSIRIPEVGDKFSSRHGQKGTCGITLRAEDMPFTVEGITPDIIINPHAIPSRMTIAQLIECILGKVTSITGDEGDGTAFTDVTVESISHLLHQCGYQERGNEVLYNGHTGRKLDAMLFMGPTYYQRLKHMVNDKIHARSRGPVTSLTRQPLEGRGRMGGLRFGEMERDCMISHGAANFMKDRLFNQSDRYRVHVCDLCGLIAIANLRKNTFECRGCKNTTQVSQVYMPYACKLLFQELMAMSIAPRMMVIPDGKKYPFAERGL